MHCWSERAHWVPTRPIDKFGFVLSILVCEKCQRQSRVSVFLYLSQIRQNLKLSVFQSGFSYWFARFNAQLAKSGRLSLNSMTKQRLLVQPCELQYWARFKSGFVFADRRSMMFLAKYLEVHIPTEMELESQSRWAPRRFWNLLHCYVWRNWWFFSSRSFGRSSYQFTTSEMFWEDIFPR